MARYIDADKIPFNEKIPFNRANEGETTIKYAYKSDIDSVPTVDVRPERHGKWIRREVGDFIPFCYHPPEEYECSVCQNTSKLPSSYCPNCGAKMDRKDGDSNE